MIYGPSAIRTTFSGWCWVTVSTSGKFLPLHLPSTHLRKPRLPVSLPLHWQYKPQPPGEIGVPRPQATCSLAASQAGVLCLCKTQMESCSLLVFKATLTPWRFLPPLLEFLRTFHRTKRLVLLLQRMKKNKKTKNHRTTFPRAQVCDARKSIFWLH